MSSSRAVYIPPAKRKRANAQKPARFHGAFTGGFSAGYFNTVDTKEGWKPSDAPRRDQRLEDFMDDQDHEEWGGPTGVRKDFQREANQDEGHAVDTSQRIRSVFTVAHRPMGPRLLRVLGWREGASAAFVPAPNTKERAHDASAMADGKAVNDDDPAAVSGILLSKKRLRRIRLQSSRIRLPPPKLDRCGLGFEALKNAPEFQQYRDQRQKLARLRARGQANVYRVSSALGGGKDEPTALKAGGDAATGSSGDYLSYEAPEDFVGTRSAAGFALRDDEDDAYDGELSFGGRASEKGGQLQPGDQYNNEIYESEDDDDGGLFGGGNPSRAGTKAGALFSSSSSKKSTRQAAMDLFGGALSSWASGTGATEGKMESSSTRSKDASHNGSRYASNGRPPIAGFRLGLSMESHKKRYPGPDLPRDYRARNHVFGPNERPAVFQTIARAMQLDRDESRRPQQHSMRSHPTSSMLQEPPTGLPPGLPPLPTSRSSLPPPPLPRPNLPPPPPTRTSLPPPPPALNLPPPPQPVLAGPQFAGLAAAMKSRFTSGTNDGSSSKDAVAGSTEASQKHVGLYQPPPKILNETSTKAEDERATDSATKQTDPIVVRRTTKMFTPTPLLCKRFGVPPPKHSLGSGAGVMVRKRRTEADYFETEVLSSARGEKGVMPAPPETHSTKGGQPGKGGSERQAVATERSNENENSEPDETILRMERPTLKELKSIFEPESDGSSSDDTDLDSIEDKAEEDQLDAIPKNRTDGNAAYLPGQSEASSFDAMTLDLVKYQTQDLTTKDNDDANDGNSGDGSNFDDRSETSRRRSRKQTKKSKRRNKSRKRKHSTESFGSEEESSNEDDCSDESRDHGSRRHRKRERRRKESKKRKKKRSVSSSRKKKYSSRED